MISLNFSIEKDAEQYVLFCNHWIFSNYKTCTVLWRETDADLSTKNMLIKSDSKYMLLEQLRNTPRIESKQNFTNTARDFVVYEALHNHQVSELLLGYDYEVKCCMFSLDRNDISHNRYVGLVIDIPKKYATVVVTYDLTKQQISGVHTELLVKDKIMTVGENEN